ncbi:hypothetical protein E2542_SST12096 [Spatholobus suberectus]|nr:hypothetical protein E2542_SST12096 [Spatholobus suberectus]
MLRMCLIYLCDSSVDPYLLSTCRLRRREFHRDFPAGEGMHSSDTCFLALRVLSVEFRISIPT